MRRLPPLVVLFVGSLLAALLPLSSAHAATRVGGDGVDRAATAATETAVTMYGDDYVSAGTSRIWRTGAGDVQVSGSVDDGDLQVGVSGGASNTYFTFDFAAATGQPLTVGTYMGAARFRDAGVPQIDIYGDGRGCNETTGRFRIIDVADDLSRLWMTYEQHCEGGSAATFGEIRFGEPSATPGVLVAPLALDWPGYDNGTQGQTVAVRTYATGTSPVTVTSATVAGDPDYSILQNGCSGAIQPGSSCPVYVSFTPTTSGDRTGTLHLGLAGASSSTASVALHGRGIGGLRSWHMVSDAGDYIGQGGTYDYGPTDFISATGNERLVQLSVDGWTAEFESPTGVLVPGTYAGATRYPFNQSGTPGIDVSGQGRGCNTSSGTFTVNDSAFDDSGKVRLFDVTFEQHCENGTPALRGRIAWSLDDGTTNPTDPTDPTDPVTPTVSIAADGSRHVTGSSAHLVVTSTGTDVVYLYGAVEGYGEVLLGQATPDAGGVSTFDVPVRYDTTFRAATDQAAGSPESSVVVPVAVVASGTAQHPASTRNGVAYYGVHARAALQARVSPAKAGRCVVFQVQAFVDGAWSGRGTSRCTVLDQHSAARFVVPGRPALAGTPLRLRAVYAGDHLDSLPAASGWTRIRFVKHPA